MDALAGVDTGVVEVGDIFGVGCPVDEVVHGEGVRPHVKEGRCKAGGKDDQRGFQYYSPGSVFSVEVEQVSQLLSQLVPVKSIGSFFFWKRRFPPRP